MLLERLNIHERTTLKQFCLQIVKNSVKIVILIV